MALYPRLAVRSSVSFLPSVNRRAATFVAFGVIIGALLLTPAVASAYTEHVVQPGETLSAIANRYGLPVETIADVNGITDLNTVEEGELSSSQNGRAPPPPQRWCTPWSRAKGSRSSRVITG